MSFTRFRSKQSVVAIIKQNSGELRIRTMEIGIADKCTIDQYILCGEYESSTTFEDIREFTQEFNIIMDIPILILGYDLESLVSLGISAEHLATLYIDIPLVVSGDFGMSHYGYLVRARQTRETFNLLCSQCVTK